MCRIQATAVGQALFEANFIESVLQDSEFSDNDALYRPNKLSNLQNRDFLIDSKISCDAHEPAWVKTIPQSQNATGKHIFYFFKLLTCKLLFLILKI